MISNCDVVLLLLASAKDLDRCQDEGDFLRDEITFAHSINKKISAIFDMGNFDEIKCLHKFYPASIETTKPNNKEFLDIIDKIFYKNLALFYEPKGLESLLLKI